MTETREVTGNGFGSVSRAVDVEVGDGAGLLLGREGG